MLRLPSGYIDPSKAKIVLAFLDMFCVLVVLVVVVILSNARASHADRHA
jgi:fumarate reductase subunit D